jgi:hypothetical protein
MTSSETPTEDGAPRDAGAAPRSAGLLGGHAGLVSGALLLAAGWGVILHLHRWYFTPAVVMLAIGWLGLVLGAAYLWRAGMAASDPGDDEDDGFWQPGGRRDELEREKRALLKAIKEIEFDHGLGKMSDADADELARFYRRRAIAVIKAIEAEGGAADPAGGEEGGVSFAEQIEREVKARLSVEAAATRKRDARDRKAARDANAAGPAAKAGAAGSEADAATTPETSDASEDAAETGDEPARRAEESA